MQWKGHEEGSVVLQYSSTAINTDTNGEKDILIYGALVQFNCYQHRYRCLKVPSLLGTLLAESLHNLHFY